MASMEFLVSYSDCFGESVTERCKIFTLGQLREIVVTPSDVKIFFSYVNNPTNFMAQINLQSTSRGTLIKCFKIRTA